jgi:broad specificity phosphatase PhoE
MAGMRPGTRPGAVILVRHGEPALSRQVRLSADGYRNWWARYELGGLKAGQRPPESLLETAARACAVIASTRPRSVETTQILTRGRPFSEDSLYIEAPLPPPAFPAWIRLSPRIWGVVARFWWWVFDHHQGQESREQARLRAAEAAGQLIALSSGGEDVLVVAHGFFNSMIAGALKRRGWRCTLDQGFRYWSARRFEAPAQAPLPPAPPVG